MGKFLTFIACSQIATHGWWYFSIGDLTEDALVVMFIVATVGSVGGLALIVEWVSNNWEKRS